MPNMRIITFVTPLLLPLPSVVAAQALAQPASPQPAQALTSTWDDPLKNISLSDQFPLKLSIGGQARWRQEFFRSFNLGDINDDNSQSRLALNANLLLGHTGKWYGRVFLEGRDAQSYGRNLPGGARPADQDRHDIQNLYAEAGYGKSMLRVGRQELSLNRDRLIGVPDWANTRSGVEGVRGQIVKGPLALEASVVRPMLVFQSRANQADSTARLNTFSIGSAPGARPLTSGLPALWQVYRYEQRLDAIGSSGSTKRITSGGRLQWQWTPGSHKANAASLELEGAVQSGHAATRKSDGWFWVAEAQWQWKRLAGKPSLALGVEEASSARNDGGRDMEPFNMLYPAGHTHGGYADVFGRANLRELHAIATWDPTRILNLRAAAYRFDRLSLDDGVYNKASGLLRAAGSSRARHAADEIDLTGTLALTKQLKLLFGGAVVLPGAFMQETAGGANRERWGFVGTTFIF